MFFALRCAKVRSGGTRSAHLKRDGLKQGIEPQTRKRTFARLRGNQKMGVKIFYPRDVAAELRIRAIGARFELSSGPMFRCRLVRGA